MTSATGSSSTIRHCAPLCLLIEVPSGCGINNSPKRDAPVKAFWAQVENLYLRCSNQIPNPVETVQAYAGGRRKILQAVTETHTKAISALQMDNNLLNDLGKQQQCGAAQARLSYALTRLILVVGHYFDPRANRHFLSLGSQLESTGHWISMTRRDYIRAVERYNRKMCFFPKHTWHALLYNDKPTRKTFQATSEIAEAPPIAQ